MLMFFLRLLFKFETLFLQIARTEILDLKAQLHAAQIENHSHKDRGNSLFSEVGH